jgi:hypothetical protein
MDVDKKMEVPLKVSELMVAMDCAQELADSVEIDLLNRPVLLVTDFNGAWVLER